MPGLRSVLCTPLPLVHMASREEPQPWSGGYQACPARGKLQEPPPAEAGARSHEVTFPHGQDRKEGSPCCSTWVSLWASVSCGQGGIGLEVLPSECVQLYKSVIDISVISETGSFGKCCHKKKSCLLSECLLVLDKVNEVSARDRKPFLQGEAGVWKRVRGTDGVASSNE